MNADNLRQNAGRWVRVGVLTLTTLGPIINVVSSQIRERTRKLQQDTAKRGQETLTQSQKQLLTVGASLADTLTELKSNPYSQELLKRGSELSGTFAEQGSKLSHELAERGSKATQVVVERGSDLARDLTQRGSKASQELAKQSQRTTREVSRRTQRAAQQAQRELLRASSQVRERATSPDYAARFWSICGFIVGLASAITAAYFFIRRRIQPNTTEDASIQLSNHAMLNGASASNKTNKVSATVSQTSSASPAPSSTPVIATDAPETPTTLTFDTPVVTPAQDTTPSTPDLSNTTFTQPESTEPETAEHQAQDIQNVQEVRDVQDIPVLPDTVSENASSLNATDEPLTVSPESEGVVSTSTSDESPLPVEVSAETATTPTQEVQEPLEMQASTDAHEATSSEPSQTIETPASTQHGYEPGDEASAISTGMPVVSADETVIPIESLGTATVSGVVADSDTPTIKQAAVSNTLTSTVEQVLNAQDAHVSSVAGPTILGVVSTKRYYPVETPLSALRTPDGDELDIIYFANEDEAKSQGYTAQ